MTFDQLAAEALLRQNKGAVSDQLLTHLVQWSCGYLQKKRDMPLPIPTADIPLHNFSVDLWTGIIGALTELQMRRLGTYPPRAPAVPGTLEVGLTEDEREVIVNHGDLQPDANGCGHIVFSKRQALQFAALLTEKAAECRTEG